MAESALLTDEDRALLVKVSSLLEKIVETFNISEDKETLASIRKAEEDLREGRARSYDEFRKELNESGEI